MARVLGCVPDLLDRSRIEAVPGAQVRWVRAEDLQADRLVPSDLGLADLVLVDLSRFRERMTDLAALAGHVRVVGFASHVDEALMDEAAAAGVQTLPRSVFFRRLGQLVGSVQRPGPSDGWAPSDVEPPR